jgi:pyridoxal phosphate enzyme (YggS family)
MRLPRQIVADNVARIRERIGAAARSAGRSASDVRLVAVSKYVDAATTALLLEAGCRDLGESRPQQLWEKAAAPALADAQWHLVGRLQSNKIRRTLSLVDMIHSIDSERLLRAIEAEAAPLDLSPQVLLEVNCSGDAAKQGFAPDELRRLVPELASLVRVCVSGLMTMAPLEGGVSAARHSFAALRELRDELSPYCPPTVRLDALSMGMSGDFEAAIAEGATIVRIGSTLFDGIV